MVFNRHSELEGRHAFLSASQGAWLNDTDDRITEKYLNNKSKERGTELHELAKELIRLKVNLPKTKKTLNMYVNDAIGFRMTPEQPLYYSPLAFGTADAISFRGNVLRIHDLKTGTGDHDFFRQLKIYAAYFFLEYGEDLDTAPEKVKDIVLIIYFNDECRECHPDPKEIREIMKIVQHKTDVLEKIEDDEEE